MAEPARSRASHRLAIIGGGITGLAAAVHAVDHVEDVVVYEAADSIGGRTQAEPFAGLDSVDTAADAFLARVPDAVDFACDVGLGDSLVHPERVGAAVWHDGLHDIPAGLVLGVPGDVAALLRSTLLTPVGRLRAVVEPFLPATSTEPDSIGALIRARFGDQVHERLADALVGSIYATDTDRFSLAEIPQIAALAENRSLFLAARRTVRRTAGTSTADAAPVFAAPRDGVGALAGAAARTFTSRGGTILTDTSPTVQPDGVRWRVDGRPVDAVVVALPAGRIGGLFGDGVLTPTSIDALASAETADVVLVTLHVGADEWPERLAGRSGYLVPKPVQRDVTAVSFGSQKWAHWRPPSGGEILRISLGRDGAAVLHLDDDEIVERALADLHRHLGVSISPREVRVSRWPGAFAQYRPHHGFWRERVRSELPHGVFVAGSSFDGIGIPACVRSGRTIAQRAVEHATALPS